MDQGMEARGYQRELRSYLKEKARNMYKRQASEQESRELEDALRSMENQDDYLAK